MRTKQSIQKTQQFIKFWEEETLSINKGLDNNKESSYLIAQYMRLLDASMQYFKETNCKDLKRQLLDCICISYENIAEVYKQNSQKLKEIEINIFLVQFISKNAFEEDSLYNLDVLKRFTRSYASFIYSIKDIDKKFTEKITKGLLEKARLLESEYRTKRNIYEIT